MIIEKIDTGYIIKPNKSSDIFSEIYCDSYFEGIKGEIIIVEDGFYGIVNKKGEECVPAVYSKIEVFNNTYVMQKNECFGVWKTNGKVVIPCQYLYIQHADNGYIVYENNLSCGVVNLSGKLVLPCKYQLISECKNWYKLTLNNHYGLANKDGDVVIPCIYNSLKFNEEKQAWLASSSEYNLSICYEIMEDASNLVPKTY